MALPQYGQDTLRRAMNSQPQFYQMSAQPQQTNQFSVPQTTGGPSEPPDFYHIGGDTPNNRDRLYNSNYSGPMFNPYADVGARRNNNPYPTPYPGIAVSPTGAVTGAQPVYAMEAGQQADARAPSGGAGPTTTRNNQRRNPGNGQSRDPRNNNGPGGNGGGGNNNGGGDNGGGGNNNNGGGGNQPKGSMNPENDPHLRTVNPNAWVQGGRDMKGYSDNEQKWLGKDSTLDALLRNYAASQGDFAQQYNQATGQISDTFRRQMTDIQRNKGVARGSLDEGMASSGLMRSSGYGQELGNLLADFSRQAFDARDTKTTGLADQLAERQNFMRQIEILRTQAREEALRRKAIEHMNVTGLIGYGQ